MGITASRTMNLAYPVLDSIFIFFFCALLIANKSYRALVWGLAAGLLYFIVDFGIFHYITHSRTITEGFSLFWILLWMSFSYGITNYVWMWLWFEKNEHFWGYSTLIIAWWISCPMVSEMFGAAAVFTISRTTGSYHGVMGLIMFISYAGALIYNMRVGKVKRISVPWMLFIGVFIQFSWEFSLLVSGIRSAGAAPFEAVRTMLVNSLVETNLGVPSSYLLFVLINRGLDRRKMRPEQA
jgi:hypothetical protein